MEKLIRNNYRFDFFLTHCRTILIIFSILTIPLAGADEENEPSYPLDFGDVFKNQKHSNDEMDTSKERENIHFDDEPIDESRIHDISRLFLRDSEVLLKPKEIQISVGFTYSTDASQRSFKKYRSRSASVPININYGVTKSMEIYAALPLLSNKIEIISDTNVSKLSESGVGDVTLGFRYKLKPESRTSPTVTTFLDIITPTGETANLADVSGVSTGSGFWGVSAGLFLSKSIDPAVVFFNAAYQYTFKDDRDGYNIQPGEIIVYGFGTGLTVNNSVAFSGRVIGSYQKETKLNRQLARGSSSEPISYLGSMSYRLTGNTRIETTVTIGATDTASDMVMGFTYIWNL